MIKKILRCIVGAKKLFVWNIGRWPMVWFRTMHLKIVAREIGKSPYVGGKCVFGSHLYLGDYCNFNGMQFIGGGNLYRKLLPFWY